MSDTAAHPGAERRLIDELARWQPIELGNKQFRVSAGNPEDEHRLALSKTAARTAGTSVPKDWKSSTCGRTTRESPANSKCGDADASQ